MRRLAVAAAAGLTLAVPAGASAFHHGGLPATSCHAPAAGSPSNDNGNAKEALTTRAGQTLPLPPVGTPGQGKGQGDEHCAFSR